jgi:hypothetical protein
MRNLDVFFFFRIGFRYTKGEQLIWIVRREMRSGKALFPLRIEPSIYQIRPWNELLATGAQTTWLEI